MPVAPGRSLAILVEVAARNQLLRARGHHAARDSPAAARTTARGAVPERPRTTRRRRRDEPGAREAPEPEDTAAVPAPGAGVRRRRPARHAPLRHPDGPVRIGQDAGDPRARGPRLLLHRQPADAAHPDRRRAVERDDAGLDKVAIVVDVREGGFLEQFPRVYRGCKAQPGLNPTLIFLEASHSALVRRFSETRRPHPLAPDRSVGEGIREEREKLNAIRAMADLIVDTSSLTVHELRDIFMRCRATRGRRRRPMVVNLVSFGYKHGVPVDADLVFDVRCLPNPHFVTRCGR
jgi:hypothetical protein